MTFLPDGFEELRTEKNYWKMSQMKEGENRFRIVMKPIAGWIDWKDGKPLRFRPNQKPLSSVDPEKPLRAFWSLYVWDYMRSNLFILEITQTSIIKTLTDLYKDDDWGDYTQYDLKLKKEGSGKDTKYMITPLPHKPLAPEITRLLAAVPVRLEALYEGKDPWTDLEPQISTIFQEPMSESKKEKDLAKLAAMLSNELFIEDVESVEQYLAYCQTKTSRDVFDLVQNWIENSDPFFKHYQSWLVKRPQEQQEFILPKSNDLVYI